jgi:DNA-binding transcriptional MocR family regulator
MVLGKITEDDLVITSGAMNAVYNCLMAVTKPGDWVAVESPVYFGILQAIQLLGLKLWKFRPILFWELIWMH